LTSRVLYFVDKAKVGASSSAEVAVFATYGITNFRFGNALDERQKLQFSIQGYDGDLPVTIQRVADYRRIIELLETFRDVNVTCELTIPFDSNKNIDTIDQVV